MRISDWSSDVCSSDLDEDGSVQLRGIGPQAWAVRPDVEIIEGQRFGTGKREIVVGTGAQRQFAGLEVGTRIHLGSQAWTVTGVCHYGDAMDSEIWGDADVVANTYRRGSTRPSVLETLESKGAHKQCKAALAAAPRRGGAAS